MLPQTVLNSRASSTTRKYLGAFKRWKQWASEHSINAFPAEEKYLALYLQHISDSSQSVTAAEDIVHALAWLNGAVGLPSPSASSFISTILEGLRRTLAKPTVKKAPITVDILKAMVEDTEKNTTLSNVRLTTACLLGFAGFLCFDELAKLRATDLSIDAEKLTLHIRKSKTDQLRKGSELVIARTSNTTCPVSMLERYLRITGMEMSDSWLLFRGICKGKYGEKLRYSGGLSYSRWRELLRDKLRQLGFPPNSFGLHSLRAGGATAAANAGVHDRLFKRHGRWKSEGAKDGYIEDSLEKRLEVSRRVGL